MSPNFTLSASIRTTRKAHSAWRAAAQATVDNAHMRYFVVHIHRLLDLARRGGEAHLSSPAVDHATWFVWAPDFIQHNQRGVSTYPRTSDQAAAETALRLPGTRKRAAASNDFAIIRRLLRDYMGRRWNRLAVAAACMLTTAGMSGVLAWLLDPATRELFSTTMRECC